MSEVEILSSLMHEGIISFVTRTIDVFVLVIISLSSIQVLASIIVSKVKEPGFVLKGKKQEVSKNDDMANKKDMTCLKIRNFINSLLLALELEGANAILKMSVFTSIVTGTNNRFSADDVNNFIFFISLLSLRIVINQTIRKFRVSRRI
ncbi:MAG: hypothetical protein M3162_05345 [Thermoproteota archaeon]|nr:hypothetical protein [Thermoproteota archaeon]